MRYDWLLEPISEAEPCGPDLDDVGDEKYLNYVLAVTGRIPDRYYRQDTGRPIDRAEIKLKEETRSDRRAPQGDTRSQAAQHRGAVPELCRRVAGFADCLEAMGGLVERFWSDVHPKAIEGDFTMRQNVFAGSMTGRRSYSRCKMRPWCVTSALVRSRLRQYAVATGAAEKREDETIPEIGEIQRSIAAEEMRAQSDLSFDAASAPRRVVEGTRCFIENSGYDYVPSFDSLIAFFSQLLELFRTARPELAGRAGRRS